MSAAAAFRAELLRTAPDAEGELLPDRLCRAAVAVLPVEGAGMTLTLLPDRRLPLGASDPVAATAERVQFTLGDGPCVAAQQHHTPVAADEDGLHQRWPVYATQLTGRTPYRSVLSAPVGGALAGIVVLTLFRHAPDAVPPGTTTAAREVADVIGAELATEVVLGGDRVLGVPAVLRGPSSDDRRRVWLAVGHLVARGAASSADALATLRATAFMQDVDLETVAAHVLESPPHDT